MVGQLKTHITIGSWPNHMAQVSSRNVRNVMNIVNAKHNPATKYTSAARCCPSSFHLGARSSLDAVDASA